MQFSVYCLQILWVQVGCSLCQQQFNIVMSDFLTSKHICTDDFLQPQNDGIMTWDGHCLSVKSPSASALRAAGVFLRLETVSGNHCSMGWPWDGRYRIISSTPMKCDAAHLSSAGVLKHSLLYHEKLPPPLAIWCSKVTLQLVWQHNIAVVPNTISGFFQLNIFVLVPTAPRFERLHPSVFQIHFLNVTALALCPFFLCV